SEPDGVGFLADADELRQPRDVDQQTRLRQAQVEHGAEGLAAGQNLHVVTAGVRSEAADGIAERRRPVVIEGGRLHARASACRRASSIAATIRRGVTGETSNSAACPASASLMALV